MPRPDGFAPKVGSPVPLASAAAQTPNGIWLHVMQSTLASLELERQRATDDLLAGASSFRIRSDDDMSCFAIGVRLPKIDLISCCLLAADVRQRSVEPLPVVVREQLFQSDVT